LEGRFSKIQRIETMAPLAFPVCENRK
jgi:hypothetical protein